ncbi:interferon-induced, double-stranded RNA-activated protein kinase-like [Oppia nitens]|uniref:interferon-induced, double-stranded RNA-activated protein kinase-like n=1 Tax=Oppia nitens TaxID=1686743 RepID=UPI0023D9D8F4|nr:interferon-induced, double-stranded RNA-activated protein kinase-like [Oppia nitens]
MQSLIRCRSPYVVDHIFSWFENQTYFIQMEYCLDNLKTIIDKKNEIFNNNYPIETKPLKTKRLMSSLEYYISGLLYYQLVECVQHIHQLKPKPFIHTDLKPDNILIVGYKKQLANNSFIDYRLKLADLGLATVCNDNNDICCFKGTPSYMAPEVRCGGQYSQKSDVYSLGIIGEQLFNICIPEPETIDSYFGHNLYDKINHLAKQLRLITSTKPIDRPNCSQIIDDTDGWLITFDEIFNAENFHNDLNMLKLNDYKLFYELIKINV